jgi:hypothetical protein
MIWQVPESTQDLVEAKCQALADEEAAKVSARPRSDSDSASAFLGLML